MLNFSHKQFIHERDKLLNQYSGSRGEERIKILARLVAIDEELEAENGD